MTYSCSLLSFPVFIAWKFQSGGFRILGYYEFSLFFSSIVRCLIYIFSAMKSGEFFQNGDFFPPPYPAGEKARLEVDPELYGYWSTDTQQEGEIEKKKNCDKSACEGEAVEDGGDDGMKRRRKKKNGFCIVTMVALVLLLVLAYQAGKRAGMWHR